MEAVRITPIAAMEMFLDLPPLHLIATPEALRAAHRLKNICPEDIHPLEKEAIRKYSGR